MKGVIFTQLIHHLTNIGGERFVDEVIDKAQLPNDGAFTAIGTYPSAYAFKLIDAVSEMTGRPAEAILENFGNYLFGRFVVLYPRIISRYSNAERMLEHVGSHIHEEVVVFNPDATPPSVRVTKGDDGPFIQYLSHRPLAHVAFGLIKGCLEHYGDERCVEWASGADQNSATFRILNKQES